MIDQRRSSQERIAALEAGADDVLDVQMGEEELVARIRAVLRRAQSRPQPTPNAQVLSLNWGCKTVEHHGLRRTLTQTEFNLMVVLTINAGRIVLRRHLLLIVWGVASDSRAKKVLNTYIFSLRRKLASIGAPHAVQTIRGVGFSLHGAASTTERSPAETPSSS
ncbi:Response regulator MprA [Rhodococcus sp. T7]|uniref:response regulator transcription factor n=1 Tax=Rhodococcus opacus TaxID=37919 RepID=UPI0013C5D2BF|nr:response regulator transcription factor [Rhodococcus opacus]KAF0966679.1 Response regulator MprA [Rhodococcus sp. T7]UOT08256.1 response regulator transcription factor [Rhodococcus opacus]